MSLLIKEQKRTTISILKPQKIHNIEQEYNKPAELFCNATIIPSACLRCISPRCIKYHDSEINCDTFPDFVQERANHVCPVEAIHWNYEKEFPEINHQQCISCGLCANRCPIGAIYKAEGKMKISEPTDNYENLSIDKDSLAKQFALINTLDKIYWKHKFQKESDIIMEQLYSDISKFDGNSIIPNLLIRNILIALNYSCAISRKGDVYTRMDAVYSSNSMPECKGVIEIEFGRDTLEASRGILDDIAVLHSREQLDKSENTPLVICLSLPNKRQGYFQVAKDINRVLDLKIQTISLGALMIFLWNDSVINLNAKDFFIDYDRMSIRKSSEYRLGRSIELSHGKLGILEPNK